MKKLFLAMLATICLLSPAYANTFSVTDLENVEFLASMNWEDSEFFENLSEGWERSEDGGTSEYIDRRYRSNIKWNNYIVTASLSKNVNGIYVLELIGPYKELMTPDNEAEFEENKLIKKLESQFGIPEIKIDTSSSSKITEAATIDNVNIKAQWIKKNTDIRLYISRVIVDNKNISSMFKMIFTRKGIIKELQELKYIKLEGIQKSFGFYPPLETIEITPSVFVIDFNENKLRRRDNSLLAEIRVISDQYYKANWESRQMESELALDLLAKIFDWKLTKKSNKGQGWNISGNITELYSETDKTAQDNPSDLLNNTAGE